MPHGRVPEDRELPSPTKFHSQAVSVHSKPATLREALRIGQPRLLLRAMNELNVNLQHSILALAGNGWSNRRIARELGIHRETVGKYLLLARSKPAISILGSEPDPDSNPAISTPGSESGSGSKPAISTAGSAVGRQSLCQPHLPQIVAAVAVGLSAQRIYQDLVCDHGFAGSYQAVKRFVRHLRQTQPIPFVRMEVVCSRRFHC